MSLLNMTAVELGKKIKAGEVTVAEACKAALEQIKATEDKLNCYVKVLDEETIMERAEQANVNLFI